MPFLMPGQRLLRGPYHFHPDKEIIHPFGETKGQAVGGSIIGSSQLAQVAEHHGAGSPSRNGKYPDLGIVPFNPFHQARVYTPVHDFLKKLTALLPLHYRPIHHHSIDIQGIATNRSAFGQGEVKVPGQLPSGRGELKAHRDVVQARDQLGSFIQLVELELPVEISQADVQDVCRPRFVPPRRQVHPLYMSLFYLLERRLRPVLPLRERLPW